MGVRRGERSLRPRVTVNLVTAVRSASSGYLVGLGLQAASPLIVTPLLTRTLTPAQFGAVTAVLVLAPLSALLISFGLPAAITRQYFHTDGSRGQAGALAKRSIQLAISLAVVTSVSGLPWRSDVLGVPGRIIVASTAGGSLGYAALAAAQSLARAEGSVAAFVAMTALTSVGTEIAGLVAARFSDSPNAFLLAWAGSNALLAATYYAWCRPRADRHLQPGGFRAALRLAMPTLPHMLSVVLLVYADRLIIAAIRGPGLVADYQVIYTVGSVGISVVLALNNHWATSYYRTAESEKASYLARSTVQMSLTGLLIALAIGGLGQALFVVLTPATYDRSHLADAASVLAVVGVLQVVYLSSAHVVFWAGKTRPLLYTSPIAAVVHVAATACLVKSIGVYAPCVASIASYTTLAALMRILAIRIDREATVPARLLLFAPAAMLGAEGARALWAPTGLRVTLAAGALAAAIALVLLATRAPKTRNVRLAGDLA